MTYFLAIRWPTSWDFLFYSAILKAFSSQLWAGDLYPRWLFDVNDSLGSPAIIFHAPLPYYVMSILEPLSKIDPHGFFRLVLGMLLALFTAGIAFYYWLLCFMPKKNAQIGALYYVSFPYLLIPIHVYFGFGQIWALACFPLLMLAAHKTILNTRYSIVFLSLGYAALCFTHLPSLVIFGWIPIAYIVFFSSSESRSKNIFYTFITILLGAGLSAIYWLPILENKPFIASHHFTEGKFDYRNDLVSMASMLKYMVIFAPLVAMYFDMPKLVRRQQINKKENKFWLIILAVFLFILSPISRPLWDIFMPLQYLQGTFRFFAVMSMPVIFIMSCWLPHAKNKISNPILSVLGLIIIVLLSICFTENPAKIKQITDKTLIPFPQHNTIWQEKAGFNDPLNPPTLVFYTENVMAKEGSADIGSVVIKPRQINLRANVKSEHAIISLHQLYFPGWQSNIREVKISENQTLLSLEIPRGEYTIVLTLPAVAGETFGIRISAVAAMILLGMGLLLAVDRRRHAQPY